MRRFEVKYSVEKKVRFDIFGLFSPSVITEAEALQSAKELAAKKNMVYETHRIEGGDLVVTMHEKDGV